MTAPTLAPELKSAVASARSFFGNQSATVLMAEGKLPHSLTPSATRAVKKPPIEPTSACASAERLHSVIDNA